LTVSRVRGVWVPGIAVSERRGGGVVNMGAPAAAVRGEAGAERSTWRLAGMVADRHNLNSCRVRAGTLGGVPVAARAVSW
jgi:hypothetical protein